MSTGPTTLPGNDLPDHVARRRWFPRLRDARIRSKLALILVVPLAAVVALATIRLVDVGRGAYDANIIRSLTVLSQDVSALTHDLHRERMAAAAFLTDRAARADSYNQHVRRTDEQIAAYNRRRQSLGDVPAAIQERLDAIGDHLATLNSTRQEVIGRQQMAASEASLRYGVILTDLVAYSDVLGQLAGEGKVGDSLRASAAFARAKLATAEQEAVAFTGLASGQLDTEEFSAFVATLTSQQEALLSFSLVADSAQQRLVNSAVTGDAIALADRAAAEVSRSVGRTPLISATEAANAVGAVTDLMRWAEIELEERLLAEADRALANVLRQAIVESILVIIALVVAIVLAVLLARSLNRALRRLREGAISVANHDLPNAVNRLRDVNSLGEGGVDEIVRQVRDPIRLNSRDEIGEVAAAFNVVHKEAVRIAAEQAALRTSVSAMFLNLARRSQALVDRMIGELDMIERSEEDPKRLAQLFELDHLATRMRRNDENLLVLAGADSTPPRREDALLVDALRAAQSEVELYNRIEFGTVDTDISVAAHAVNDVVRLVAELLDNATRFSPPNTVVIAEARRIRDYVIIQVEDRGLGLTDEQLEALNRRLAQPQEVDVSAFRLMGLAVVSRLAARYGIRVELRRTIEGGTVAQVTLPSSVVVLPQVRGREPALGRRQPLAVEQGPATVGASNGSWPEPVAQDSRRPSAATLANQWRPSNPPAQWSALPSQPASAQPATAQQIAGYPAATQPTPQQQPAQPSYSAAHPAMSQATVGLNSLGSASAPTMAYPTVQPQPDPAPAAAAPARQEDPREVPIFREMETVWFRSHGQDSTTILTMPTAGYPPPPVNGDDGAASTPARAPLPTRTPGAATSVSNVTSGTSVSDASAPAPYASSATASTMMSEPITSATTSVAASSATASTGSGGDSVWRTAADEGWARASRAATPTTAGTTRSGLPKRVPQAQLVPGGVEVRTERERTKRTPDEVRGLLSAYHRGVQRGRAVGSEQYGIKSTKETTG